MRSSSTSNGPWTALLQRPLADPVALLALLHEHVVEVAARRPRRRWRSSSRASSSRRGGTRPAGRRAGSARSGPGPRGPGSPRSSPSGSCPCRSARTRASSRCPCRASRAGALGEEAPDEVVVLVAEREVGAAQLGQPERPTIISTVSVTGPRGPSTVMTCVGSSSSRSRRRRSSSGSFQSIQ